MIGQQSRGKRHLNNQNEYHFTGDEYMIIGTNRCPFSNNFTYEFWVRTGLEQQLDIESKTGISGVNGQKYAFGPDCYSGNDAGMGISIGSNGIGIYEHSINHLPAVLVFPWNFSKWQHVAVVYENKIPHLYLNGQLVRTGNSSERANVFPTRYIGGFLYGCFEGSMKNIRIWNFAKTQQQISEEMDKDLTGYEQGLYWHENQNKGIQVYEGRKLDVEISVIMPSYNRFPYNKFSLHSLNQQTFPCDKMEVIFIDDGSTDATSTQVQNDLDVKFPFKYIRHQTSKGRGPVRNIGVNTAAGETLLFLDAEMLCPPNLVQNHMNHHKEGSLKIVSGSMNLKRVFTVYTPALNDSLMSQLERIYADSPEVRDLINKARNRYPIQLLSPEQMNDNQFLDIHSYTYDYFQEALNQYGNELQGFHYAWINFITSNVSLSKALVEKAGMFDESFYGFGWEDWELGYRISKLNAHFIHDDEVKAYHQEHPISSENLKQSLKNFYLFQQKHPVMDIRLFVLDMIPNRKTFPELNLYLNDYKKWRKEWPNQFQSLDLFLLELLEHTALLLSEGKKVEHLMQGIGVYAHSSRYEEIIKDVEKIKQLGKYPFLMDLYEFLMSMS